MFLFLTFPLCFISSVETISDSVVITSSGGVRGFRTTQPVVDAFLGIPFAKPPVGRLRFRHPEPVEPWEGIRNATQYAFACYQAIDPSNFSVASMWNPKTNISEDCLYLNVWVPFPRRIKTPVMVWIHGGAFTRGSTSRDMFNGEYLADQTKLIIVTLAYRVGPLGFLYLNDESAPGNQGLFDQIMGMQWVKRNIEDFGGDPNQVTVFGCSAGAISIALHLMSPLSGDLFHRAIMESGVFAIRSGFPVKNSTEAKRRSMLYAVDILGCPLSENARNISDCLREMDPDRLIRNQYFPSGDMILYPVTDGNFLPRAPSVLLATGEFKKCPILLGTVQDEGSYFVLYSVPDFLSRTYKTMTIDQFVTSMKRIYYYLPGYPETTNPDVLQGLIDLYTNKGSPNDTDKNVKALISSFSDIYFVCPTNDFAKRYSDVGEGVFMYQLTQRYERNPWPSWMGVVHGDEMIFVFGSTPAPGLDLTQTGKQLSRAMMTYLANFARTGLRNPNNPEDNGTLGVWPNYKSTSGYLHLELHTRYLNDSAKPESSKSNLRVRECKALYQLLQPDSSDGNICQLKWSIRMPIFLTLWSMIIL